MYFSPFSLQPLRNWEDKLYLMSAQLSEILSVKWGVPGRGLEILQARKTCRL